MQIFESRIVTGILTMRQKVINWDAAAAQAPHHGELVATGEVQDLVPPERVEGDDGGVVVAAEYEVVLHQACVPGKAVQPKKEPYPKESEIRYIPHIPALAGFIVSAVARRVRHSAILYSSGFLDAGATVESIVRNGYIAVNPDAAFVFGKKLVRMHLWVAGSQCRIGK